MLNLIIYIGCIIITTIIIILYYEKKIKKLKEDILNNKTNKILNEVLKLSTKKENPKKAAEKIVLALRKYFEFNYCTVYQNKNNKLKIIASNVELDNRDSLEVHINKVFETLEYEAQIKHSKKCLSYPTAEMRDIRYSYFIPLRLGEEVIGAIHMESKDIKNMDKIEKEFFSIVIKNITIVFQNMAYLEQLRLLGLKDGLTGLYNKTYLREFIQNKLKSNKKFIIGMADIDYFKKLNDTYGHNHGDKVLKQISNYIKEELTSINSNNEVMRWGGEEFIIFLDEDDIQKAFYTIDTIRAGIYNLNITNDDEEVTKITTSFGIASYIEAKTVDKLIECADKALYESKKTRNKTTIFRK